MNSIKKSPLQKTHEIHPLLEYRNISIAKGDKVVLHDISVLVKEGENIAIIGPNGSGKSTFLKTITREVYPMNTGQPTVFRTWGLDNWNVFDLRSHIGVVSNELQHTFTRNISGRDVLISGFFSSIGLFNSTITHAMEDRADEIGEFLEITHLMKREIADMSSDEARRLLIGRALIHHPKILILDEPTSSLDLHTLHTLRTYLRKIAQRGIGIILVTHQLHDIIPEIHRILMIKDGRIFRDGEKNKIITDNNISELFAIPVKIMEEGGYYYATGY
ncbi:MAG: molybdenum ABC transporter ATP-binding protein [Methanomicrobiales archaeon HGW-Methanomicrobiales-4]|nr:MAG: molybdenum ABC transporter ATP-binding protein [Methanomicrobiales archaeon HGW-Methanomicrobiales-4]